MVSFLDGIEEVRFAGPVSADDHVMARVKGLDHGLLTVGLKALKEKSCFNS